MLRKIVRDRKKGNVHFYFKAKHASETTEYIVDEFILEELLRDILSYRWFMQKRIDGKIVFPEFPSSERVARMVARAKKVFGSKEVAGRWLRKPQPVLGGRMPLDMLWSDDGVKEVEDLLGRILHGVIS